MNHMLGLKWQLLLNSSFVCQILAGEQKNKKVINWRYGYWIFMRPADIFLAPYFWPILTNFQKEADCLTHYTPVPTVVVIQICLLYSQHRLYSSQNIKGFYVIYFCFGNSRGVLYFELLGMMS